MVKVGGANNQTRTKIWWKFIHFAKIWGTHAICIIGLGGWTYLGKGIQIATWVCWVSHMYIQIGIRVSYKQSGRYRPIFIRQTTQRAKF